MAARFLVLKHPTDNTKKRFYFCPKNGLFELKKVNAPTTDPRSILFTGPTGDSATDIVSLQNPASLENEVGLDNRPQRSARIIHVGSGYVNKAAELFVATPFDMVFILIALLRSYGIPPKAYAGKALFQPIDDMLDPYLEDDKHLQYILEKGRSILEHGAAQICDIVEAGDEKMFRLNEDMLFKTILHKAQNAVERGLPASLEDKFVRRALEKPVVSVKREESLLSVMTELSSVDGCGNSFGTSESQSSTITSASSAVPSEASSTTAVLGNEDDSIPDEIVNLQRLRTAWSFIMFSYLPNKLADSMTGLLFSDACPVDFVPLENHLSRLAILRADALASRSLSGFGQKRGLEDDAAFEGAAEKKRKQEENEKRKKAGESRGLRDLKKVDVSGMKKMSAFFVKTSATKVKS